MLDRAGIRQWDVLLIGDGSGTGWTGTAGWACVLIDQLTRGRQLFYGAATPGSVNFAETMPYAQAINWYDQEGGGKQLLERQGRLSVHILTDSQVIATWGNKSMGDDRMPRKHVMFWAGLREMRRIGYSCYFHWAPRSDTLLNWTSDLMAGLSRRALIAAGQAQSEEALSKRAAAALDTVRFCDPQTGQPINLYGLNHQE